MFRVAATYMGTVVGAGFASGQEALRFFAAYGAHGLWGLALATGLLCAYGVLIMDLGHRLGARSHREVLEYACGPRVGAWTDLTVSAFLLAILSVMLAGGGAVAAEQLHLPLWAGALATAALTVATILSGMGGIMTANSIVVPLLTLLVSGLSLYSVSFHGLHGHLPAPALAAAPNWFVSAWLYAGYNLVLSISVLAPLGAEVADRGALALGGLIGGLGLGLLAAGIHLSLGIHLPEASQFQIPMLFLARFHPRPVQVAYTLILWAEIYTTAIASAFGLARRVADSLAAWRLPGHPAGQPRPGHDAAAGRAYRWAALAAVCVALAGAPFGFSRLVSTLYPAFGVVSVIVLLMLGWQALLGRGKG